MAYSLSMALGARRADVVRLVLRNEMVTAGIGILLGLGAALPLTRLTGSLLYGAGAYDPLSLGWPHLKSISTVRPSPELIR